MDYQLVIDYLKEQLPDLYAIYIFGSFADGSHNPASDLDLAVLNPWDAPIDFHNLLEIKQNLEVLLKKDIDLLDLDAVAEDFAFLIVSTGNRLYCKDKTYCDTFDMIAISKYQKLEEERKDIIESVIKRGSIYG